MIALQESLAVDEPGAGCELQEDLRAGGRRPKSRRRKPKEAKTSQKKKKKKKKKPATTTSSRGETGVHARSGSHVLLVVMLALSPAARARAAVGARRDRRAEGEGAEAPRGGQHAVPRQKYKEALEQYKAAVKAWDHPAIRFNIVRCLIQLDRPVEASRQPASSRSSTARRRSRRRSTPRRSSYQKLLANQIADVEISCNAGRREGHARRPSADRQVPRQGEAPRRARPARRRRDARTAS